jgi:class 3 adenylate cyclase/tetratricopeptide (TPR) repeat protein
MKCPECQHENPDSDRFCRECGSKLSFPCPECGTDLFPGDKFCGQCGHKLTQLSEAPPKDLSFDEKIEKIQRYLPKGLTDKILSQRDKIEGERKQVTVMFADMAGFTPLVDKIGPEEAYSIMDQVYEILIHKVHDYEGTVNEMTGDGIMALFGAPIALEDAPQRAIRSAYAIHREMVKFSDKMKQEREGVPPLKMRIGIHTGPVVVGALGNDLRVEFKVVGDTVNLASRMEDIAEPGATHVTEETFKLTEGLFRYESLGERKVKGKEEPIKTYRVIGPSTRRTRFDVSAERGLTPFVGRERELEILLDGFERVKSGRGQAFSVMGEAGVGKSRLLYEFRNTVVNEDATFLEGKCLSYSRSVAYHPIIDLYKSNFDIRDNDEDHHVKDKVKKGLKQFDVEEASILPYLLELLSIKDSGIDQIPLSPEGRKDRMIETLIRIPFKASNIRPLILVIEDLHWMDQTSEEVLKYLLESIAGARILLLFTYRPEFVHTWGGKSYHSQVNLNRLSNRESLAMVTYLIGTEDIETDLEELILEKAEGVPFYIEEFIKSLKDLGIIERKDSVYCLAKDIEEVIIPSTIHDVIMARVDSLPEGTKEVLQTGSVIEREFSYELIKRVTDLTEQELMSHFSVLRDSELVYERGIYPQSTYIFKHALTREVIYNSILNKRKKQLHEEIGNAIEDLYKENINEHYAVLTEHYIEAESYEKGAEYSRLTERKFEKTASLDNAIEYAQKRISCLEKLPVTDDLPKRIIDARTDLGLYYMQMGSHLKSKNAVEPIVELVLNGDYKKRMSQIYSILGAYSFWIEGDFTKGLKQLDEALKIAVEINDVVSLFAAHTFLGVCLSSHCEFEKSLYHYEKALDINIAANSIWGISLVKSLIGFNVYDRQGNIELGYQTTQEALFMAEENGDTYCMAMANMSHGISCFNKGFLKEAEEYCLRSVHMSEKINSPVAESSAFNLLGDIYFELGEYQKSVDHYGKTIRLFEDNRFLPSGMNLSKIGVARAKVMNNEKDIDLESLYGYEAENNIKILESSIQRYIGEILMNMDGQHLNEAAGRIKKALEMAKRNGMMWNLGRDYALYAELFKRKGEQSKAKENLNKAIEILRECGAEGWVVKYEKELAAIS